jgi:hypothetical protein
MEQYQDWRQRIHADFYASPAVNCQSQTPFDLIIGRLCGGRVQQDAEWDREGSRLMEKSDENVVELTSILAYDQLSKSERRIFACIVVDSAFIVGLVRSLVTTWGKFERPANAAAQGV